jgi:hypothetical protein
MEAKLKTKRTDVKVPVLAYVIDQMSHKKLVYLEMFGALEGQRAIWANIVKHRTGTTGHDPTVKTEVTVDGKIVIVHPADRYLQMTVRNHVCVLHGSMAHAERAYIIGGSMEQPSPWFYQFLQKQIDGLPFLEEWLPQLWKLGLEHELIVSCQTQGTAEMFWAINKRASWRRKEYSWEDVVKEIVCQD